MQPQAAVSVTDVEERHLFVIGMSPFGGDGRRLQQATGLIVRYKAGWAAEASPADSCLTAGTQGSSNE